MNFGNLLKSIRKQKGLTQYEFSSLLFISPNTLSKLEHNKTTPNLELISLTSKLSNLTMAEVLLTVKFGDNKKENEQKNKIVQSLLMYLATNPCVNVDINVVITNSGVDLNEGKLLFSSLQSILEFIEQKFDEVLNDNHHMNDRLDTALKFIESNLLPLWFEKNHELKILFTDRRVCGIWNGLLKQTYKKNFSKIKNINTFGLPKEFVVTLVVAQLVASIDAWISSPLPLDVKDFQIVFKQVREKICSQWQLKNN